MSSYKECRITGSIVFSNETTKEYQYYSATFVVKATKDPSTIELRTHARTHRTHELAITNPLSKQVILVGKSDCADLTVPASVVVPARTTQKVLVDFFPVLVKDAYPPAKVSLACPELGEFAYVFVLSSTQAPTEKPQRLQCALGMAVTTSLRFSHFSKTATDFQFRFQDPKQTAFVKANTQSSIKVPASVDAKHGAEVTVDVTFEPTRIGDFRETVELVSSLGGTYIFPLLGTCLPPQRQGPIDIKPNQTTSIAFRNVFPETITFQVATDTPSFVVSKASEVIPGKKSTGFSVAYKPTDSTQTTRGKLTVTGTPTSTGDMQPIAWVYYLRGLRDIDVQEALAAEKASKTAASTKR